MKGKTVRIEIKTELQDSIIVPNVAHASKIWIWNKSQKPRIQAVEQSYLRGACGVIRVDGDSDKCIHGRSAISCKGEGISYKVVRWFGYLERMSDSETDILIQEWNRCFGFKRMNPAKWDGSVGV